MIWIPHPADIATFRDTGTGDMGSVTDLDSKARFTLARRRFVLVYVLIKFSGGTGTATLTLKRDHRDDSGLYDFNEAAPWTGMGTTGTGDKDHLDWRIPYQEYPRYTYQPPEPGQSVGDVLVFDWTNPDSPNMRWAIEVGLADATRREEQIGTPV